MFGILWTKNVASLDPELPDPWKCEFFPNKPLCAPVSYLGPDPPVTNNTGKLECEEFWLMQFINNAVLNASFVFASAQGQRVAMARED